MSNTEVLARLELVKRWAEGEEVEWKDSSGNWCLYGSNVDIESLTVLIGIKDIRLKPLTLWCRMYYDGRIIAFQREVDCKVETFQMEEDRHNDFKIVKMEQVE